MMLSYAMHVGSTGAETATKKWGGGGGGGGGLIAQLCAAEGSA